MKDRTRADQHLQRQLAAEEQQLVAHADEHAEDPLDPGPQSVSLVGPVATAYLEFRLAAAGLEGSQRAFQAAQERYRVALGRFSSLAVTSTGADSGG